MKGLNRKHRLQQKSFETILKMNTNFINLYFQIYNSNRLGRRNIIIINQQVQDHYNFYETQFLLRRNFYTLLVVGNKSALLMPFRVGNRYIAIFVFLEEVAMPVATKASVTAMTSKDVARSLSTPGANARIAVTAYGNSAGIFLKMASCISAGPNTDMVGQRQ